MARFGNLPIKLESGVTATVEGQTLTVKGPKGILTREIPESVLLEIADGRIVVSRKGDSRSARELHGTTRAHVANMAQGVSAGWQKTLEIVGAGYRAEVRGKDLVMQIGYSHPVTISAPEGISFKLEKSFVTVDGVDRDMVGHIAAITRASRKPEPYKGTGIKYKDEIIKRKAGKQAAK